MTEWQPTAKLGNGPRYRAIVEALEADIVSGRIAAGHRLPPHRELAERLGLSVGTVTRAYTEAEQRGLVSGEVGRGTFVLEQGSNWGRATDLPQRRSVDLALNVPPLTGADELVRTALAEIVSDRSIGRLLAYQPHQGVRSHREAVASWFDSHGLSVDPDEVFVTQGAQHALSVAFAVLAAAGQTVLTEALTYSGVLSLSSYSGQVLHGVETDEYGIVPDALRTALSTTGARALYLTPTLQTPMGSMMPDERRRQVAAAIRDHDAVLVEDDAYGFLPERAPQPISALIPERSFYVVSFAKCLAPGLRVGAMTIPRGLRSRVLNGLRATGWMAAPIMVEVLARLLRDGSLARQAERKREVAAGRVAIARRVLDRHMRPQPFPSFHVWLPLPIGRTASALVGEAASAGITLSGPTALRPFDEASSGIRLCLGAASSEDQLEWALSRLRTILDAGDVISVV